MLDFALMAGLLASSVLLALLILSLYVPRWAIWPVGVELTPSGIAFWSLFRIANGAALFALALLHGRALVDVTPLGLAAAFVTAIAVPLYAASCWTLGHPGTYCRTGSLVDEGLYGWSRNPQYAVAIGAYLSLGALSLDASIFGFCLLVCALYVMMAHLEEPWLVAAYGDAYRAYARTVPRFFDARRFLALAVDSVAGLFTETGKQRHSLDDVTRLKKTPVKRDEQRRA
jgi:protein-S-isoprenylcysteine O-methyltransferase Ste14